MKIRQGFVSNSSSSSFVCNICRTSFEGYDGQYDVDYHLCYKQNHHICEYCFDKVDEKINYYLENYEEAAELLNIVEDITDKNKVSIIKDYLFYDNKINELICPCCNLVHIDGSLEAAYLREKYNLDREDVLNEIREKYKTLKEWKKRNKK